MNRHKRHVADARVKGARLAEALTNAHRIGQGVWAIHIYAAEAFLEALLDPALLDDDMRHDRRVASLAIEQIMRGSSGMLCLLCPQILSAQHLPHSLVILRPSLDAIRATPDGGCYVLANGVCRDCAATPELSVRVVDYYRRNIISDLRELRLAEAGAA